MLPVEPGFFDDVTEDAAWRRQGDGADAGCPNIELPQAEDQNQTDSRCDQYRQSPHQLTGRGGCLLLGRQPSRAPIVVSQGPDGITV